MKFRKNSVLLLTISSLFFLFIILFCRVFYIQSWQGVTHWVSDTPVHTKFILDFVRKGDFPIYSIWYVTVYLMSGLSSQFIYLAYTSIFLLAILTVSKFYITIQILEYTNKMTQISIILGVCLLICMPIISYYSKEQYPYQVIYNNWHIYLGNIAPNQWHNSTLILAMPVNLILFDFATKRISNLKIIDAILVGLLFIISILCKPNFALAFLPIVVLSLFIIGILHNNLYKSLFKIGIIVLCSFLVLAFQYYYTFVHNDLFQHPSKTIFAPFLVWGTYSPHIWLSCLLSLALPIAVGTLYFRNVFKDIQLIISWATLFVAIIIMATLAEFPRYGAFNYIWGAIASNYILFAYSVRLLLIKKNDWKKYLCYLIFSLHVLSGGYLLYSFFVYQTPLIM